MASPHTEQIRRLRAESEQKGGHLLGYDRNSGAPMHRITGYHQDPYSNIDYSKLLNSGMRHEEAIAEAQRLHREGKQIGPDGVQRTNDNPSARARALREETTRRASGGGGAAGKSAPTAGKPNPLSGPGNDIPLSPTGGYLKPTMPEGNTPVPNDPFGTGMQPMGDNNPFSPPNTPPPTAAAAPSADTSTSRQPVGMMDPENTPAQFRRMASDAEMGRAVKTSGGQGLTPSPTPGGRPTQAADFRREISSKYGTGTNETRQPGQGPGMTSDLMGRPTTMKDFAEERKAVQRSKDQIPEDEEEDTDVDESEETQEAA